MSKRRRVLPRVAGRVRAILSSACLGVMSVLEEALAGHRIVVGLPAGELRDWIAVVEVLVQEGIRAWAWPADQLDTLPEAISLFGRRAHIGVAGVLDDAQLRHCADAGARFWLSPLAVSSTREIPLPYLAGALTPNEVSAASRERVAPVLITPADALGGSYARTLPALVPETEVVPWGRLERYQCEMWLDAGAKAVVVQDVIVRPELTDGVNVIDEVSRRASSFGQLATTDRP